MSLPYLPLYVDDYEADTAHLSLLEDGIYNRLLRLLWRSPKCQVPNDIDWIARKIRVSGKAEREALANVLNEFFSTRRGVIFSKRLSAEYVRISESIQKRKEAGKSGGRAKSLKTNKSKPSNARAMPEHTRAFNPEPEPEPYPDEKPNGFSERASARKKPSGWIERKNHSQAFNEIISRIESHEHDGTQDSSGSALEFVPRLPAIGACGR